MNSEIEQRIARQLDAQERLLWTGQPRQGVILRGSDAVLIPFTIIWGGFAILWEVMAIRGDAPIFFALWGVPFVLAGIYMMVGRFFWDAKRRSRTFYGVTDRRVILLSGVLRPHVRSVNLRTLSDLSVTARADGSGDVMLGPSSWITSWYAGSGWPGVGAQLPPMLESIPRARDVYDIIRRAEPAKGN